MTSNDDIIPWDLPRDVLSKALSFLPPKSIALSSRVAKLWKDAVQSEPSLREKLNMEKALRFGVVEPSISDPIVDDCTKFACKKSKDKIALACWNAVFVLDLKTGNILLDLRNSERSPRVLSFVDTILVAGYSYGELCGWDIVTGAQTFRMMICAPSFAPSFHPEITSICGVGDFMAVGQKIGGIGVWERESWKKYGHLRGYEKGVFSLESIRHGKLLVSVSPWIIGIWDVAQLACLRVFDSIEGFLMTSCVDESESVIVCGTREGEIYIHSLKDKGILDIFPGHKGSVWFFSAKNSRILSQTPSGEIAVWDLDERKCIRNLQGEEVGPLLIGVWIDGDKIVAVSKRGQIIVWDFTKLCS